MSLEKRSRNTSIDTHNVFSLKAIGNTNKLYMFACLVMTLKKTLDAQMFTYVT
jgi:hypothetical protein